MGLRGVRSAVSRSKQQRLISGTVTWILFQKQWAGEYSFLKEHHDLTYTMKWRKWTKGTKSGGEAQWKLSVMQRNCPGKRRWLGPRCWQWMWEHYREGCILTVVPRKQDQGLCSGGNRKREPWVASAFSIGHLIPCRNAQSSHTGSLNYTWSGPPPYSVAPTQDITPCHIFHILPHIFTSFSAEQFPKTSILLLPQFLSNKLCFLLGPQKRLPKGSLCWGFYFLHFSH